MPQQQRAKDGLGVSGKGCRSNHSWQDADGVSSGYRPVGLASDVAVTVDAGNAAVIESFLKVPHTPICRRDPRFLPGNFNSVDNSGRGSQGFCGKPSSEPDPRQVRWFTACASPQSPQEWDKVGPRAGKN
ncbi:hypothetical protein TPCV2_08850 [Cutibacterium avidum]|nr:hypothetical protein TPCV4_01560 [Cutibacterium avidum]